MRVIENQNGSVTIYLSAVEFEMIDYLVDRGALDFEDPAVRRRSNLSPAALQFWDDVLQHPGAMLPRKRSHENSHENGGSTSGRAEKP